MTSEMSFKQKKTVRQDRSTGTDCGHQRAIAAQSSSVKKKAVEKIRAEETSMKVVWNKGVSLFRTGVVGGGPTVIGGRNNSEKRKDQI